MFMCVCKAESTKSALQKIFEDGVLRKLISLLIFDSHNASGRVQMVVF